MQWRDGAGRYGLVSVVLHWLVAVPVLALVVLGLLMEWAIDLDGDELYARFKHLHVSTGVILAALVAPRIGWRLRWGWRGGRTPYRYLGPAAAAVWWLLLAGVAIQCLTGVLGRFTARDWPGTGAAPLPVFGLFEIPSPFDAQLPWLNGLCEAVHDVCADLLQLLVAAHVLAALGRRFWRVRKGPGSR